MSTWNYKFGDNLELQLEDNPIASASMGSVIPESDYVFAEIDAEVHRLTALIQKSEYEIYKLRKWQRVMKKNE